MIRVICVPVGHVRTVFVVVCACGLGVPIGFGSRLPLYEKHSFVFCTLAIVVLGV